MTLPQNVANGTFSVPPFSLSLLFGAMLMILIPKHSCYHQHSQLSWILFPSRKFCAWCTIKLFTFFEYVIMPTRHNDKSFGRSFYCVSDHIGMISILYFKCPLASRYSYEQSSLRIMSSTRSMVIERKN